MSTLIRLLLLLSLLCPGLARPTGEDEFDVEPVSERSGRQKDVLSFSSSEFEILNNDEVEASPMPHSKLFPDPEVGGAMRLLQSDHDGLVKVSAHPDKSEPPGNLKISVHPAHSTDADPMLPKSGNDHLLTTTGNTVNSPPSRRHLSDHSAESEIPANLKVPVHLLPAKTHFHQPLPEMEKPKLLHAEEDEDVALLPPFLQTAEAKNLKKIRALLLQELAEESSRTKFKDKLLKGFEKEHDVDGPDEDVRDNWDERKPSLVDTTKKQVNIVIHNHPQKEAAGTHPSLAIIGQPGSVPHFTGHPPITLLLTGFQILHPPSHPQSQSLRFTHPHPCPPPCLMLPLYRSQLNNHTHLNFSWPFANGQFPPFSCQCPMPLIPQKTKNDTQNQPHSTPQNSGDSKPMPPKTEKCECPTGWKKHGKECYEAITKQGKLNSHEALTICTTKEAQLAKPCDEKEKMMINSLVKERFLLDCRDVPTLEKSGDCFVDPEDSKNKCCIANWIYRKLVVQKEVKKPGCKKSYVVAKIHSSIFVCKKACNVK